jgi:hypothetical protein
LVYILAEIVTKHIKQQLIFNFERKISAGAHLFTAEYSAQTNSKRKQKNGEEICIGVQRETK